jgi:hypothetical protein
MRRHKKWLIALILAALAAAGVAPAAPAQIVRSGNTFTQTTDPCSCVTTIDGYLFAGVPYYDASPAVDSAVELWWALAADPSYVPLPPITSISTTATVSGTVNPPGGRSFDSYGTGSYGTGLRHAHARRAHRHAALTARRSSYGTG